MTLLLFAVAGSVLAVSAWAMEVKVSRGLRLAVVDARRPSPARDAVQRAVVSQLAAAVSTRVGTVVEISAKCVSAADARAQWSGGACDAVLVLGEERPAVLRRIDALTVCGELDPETGTRAVYLILGKDDGAMRDLLTGAFASVLADPVALKAIEAAERDAENAPAIKVAGMTR